MQPEPITNDGGEAIAQREDAILAPYAMRSAQSAGRVHLETPHPYRGCFQRDRDRIVHCSAFRRLSDKTQVFTGKLSDYHRTRLTHTLEVASIARSIGRALRLNEDLIESLALLHDIGHPPYGHAGEDVLNECLGDEGFFCHNSQALRIVEKLERRYPEMPGLNLSQEILDGQAYRVSKTFKDKAPLLESQVVDVADSIAYNSHDADDAMEFGLLDLDDLLELPLWREADRRVRSKFKNLHPSALRGALIHELIDWQVGDVLTTTMERLEQGNFQSVADVQAAGVLVKPSDPLAKQQAELKKYLYKNVYRHKEVIAERELTQGSLREMFYTFMKASPEKLPEKFAEVTKEEGHARAVVDYLSGMTDRFALQTYADLHL